jgi:hypothetical protein
LNLGRYRPTSTWRCLLFLIGLGLASGCQAAALQFCDHQADLSAAQKDRLFRFAALIKDELAAADKGVALIARSGLNLDRLGVRYSHAGLSLRDSPATPWAVRQLYYACDEGQPRLFDQGMSGFVLGTDNPELSFISIVWLPEAAAQPVQARVLDKRQALQTLAPVYSANAFAYGLRYQNCNQWVIETLAAAWGAGSVGVDSVDPANLAWRQASQQWLHEQGYQPSRIDVAWPVVTALAPLLPWLHNDDHPPADLRQAVYQVSMPASIETFVQDRWPGARRLEICQAGGHVVLHEGWQPVAEGCLPGPGDRTVQLD